jgi:hypothetical protein
MAWFLIFWVAIHPRLISATDFTDLWIFDYGFYGFLTTD